MKHIVNLATHIIIGSASMLLFESAFDSSMEFAGYCLATAILVTICYWLRKKINSFWIFLGSHVLLIFAGILLLSIVGNNKWYLAIWILWILYSAILRLVPAAEWLDKPGKVYVGVLVIVHFAIGGLGGSTMAQNLSIWVIVICFLLELLYANLAAADEFVMTRTFSTKIDGPSIKKLNVRLSLFYTGVLGAVIGFFSLFRVDGLWQIMVGWLKKIVQFFARFLPEAEQVQQEEVKAPDGMMNMLEEMTEQQEPSVFMKWLSEILYHLTMALIVAVILGGIIYAVIHMYRHFHSREQREEGDKVIETLSFGTKTTRERKERFFERFEKNPAKRIRKIYKKNMKRFGAKRMSEFSYMPPEEQMQLLREQEYDEEAITEIRDLYEKARYSEELLNDGQAERMRTIMHR